MHLLTQTIPLSSPLSGLDRVCNTMLSCGCLYMVVRSELIARANKQHDQISGGQNNGVAEVFFQVVYWMT